MTETERAPLTGELEIGDDQPTALYRFYDAEGLLIYAGITKNLKRPAADYKGASWWPEVARKTVTLYPTPESAAAAETAVIEGEAPAQNNARGGSLGRGHFPRQSASDPADAYMAGEWITLGSARMRRWTAANVHEMDF
jgi:hypothetical protein